MTDTTADEGGFFSSIDAVSILHGVLGVVSFAFPAAAPVISIIEKAAPYIIAAKPLISAAIKEGPGAFAAAKEAAPQLADAIKSLASHVMATGKFGASPGVVVENVARAVFGHQQMTAEEEKRWMDNATPHNDPSQENSIYGSG